MPMPRTLTAALALSLALAFPAEAAEDDAPRPFDRIASLAGEWEVLDNDDRPTTLHVRYEVVANGSAVVETLFGGSVNETVTLYHQEEGLVTATQVSGRQRPARLVPGVTEDAATLVFRNDGDVEDTGRLTTVRMTWLDGGDFRLQWTHSGTDADETRRFEMRRTGSLQELIAETERLRASLDALQAQVDRHLKRQVVVDEKGARRKRFREVETFPIDPGWNRSGTPFRLHMADQTRRFASTYASAGDEGHTVAHYPFEAGPGCRVRFSLLGGHAYVAVVEESRAPPRKIGDIVGFSLELLEGRYGDPIERVVGKRWEGHPRAVDWDLSRYEGKTLRLYVVDAESNHYGQIAISEITIREEVTEE
jgi:hypothetical protein